MTVEHVWYDGHACPAPLIVSRRGDFMKTRGFMELFKVLALCNKAFFIEDEK